MYDEHQLDNEFASMESTLFFDDARGADELQDSDDDAAWWRLYRQAMPWEEYSSLSKGQKGNRRRRFQKAVAAKRPEKAVEST